MKLREGTAIGRYRVDRYVNAGGMQEVYQATDTLLGRTVALKRPKNDDGERRFDYSAHASARVNDPRVTRTLDYFEYEDERYFVEEFVEGMDLGALLKRICPFDPYVTSRILHALAHALVAVHAAGVVHRDLKPSNIMAAGGFTMSDVKVTDFGVAKMAIAEIDAAVAGGTLSMTGSKTLIGQLPYLAPEILEEKSTVDPAADIWAVAAIAFHFLCGKPPFGIKMVEIFRDIFTAPLPSLPEVLDKHPQYGGPARELYGVLAPCLQRDRAARPTAKQLLSLCDRLCYSTLPREVATVTGYPGNSFGFARCDAGTVFFHVASVLGSSAPRVDSEVWITRHPGSPRDRAHPVVPIQPEQK